jgi:hypothetical protein
MWVLCCQGGRSCCCLGCCRAFLPYQLQLLAGAGCSGWICCGRVCSCTRGHLLQVCSWLLSSVFHHMMYGCSPGMYKRVLCPCVLRPAGCRALVTGTQGTHDQVAEITKVTLSSRSSCKLSASIHTPVRKLIHSSNRIVRMTAFGIGPAHADVYHRKRVAV